MEREELDDAHLEAMFAKPSLSEPDGRHCESGKPTSQMCISPSCNKYSLTCNDDDCRNCNDDSHEKRLFIKIKTITKMLNSQVDDQSPWCRPRLLRDWRGANVREAKTIKRRSKRPTRGWIRGVLREKKLPNLMKKSSNLRGSSFRSLTLSLGKFSKHSTKCSKVSFRWRIMLWTRCFLGIMSVRTCFNLSHRLSWFFI